MVELNKGQNEQSFKALIRVCRSLVSTYELHSGDGPVNLTPVLEKRNIGLEFIPMPEGGHGFALFDVKNKVPPHICINESDPAPVRSETLAHELVHLLKHFHDRFQFCWNAQPTAVEEKEAVLGAAMLIVPLPSIYEMTRGGDTSEVIARRLGVRAGLVEMRYELALKLKELKPTFQVFNYGNEVAFFGRAIPKSERRPLFQPAELRSDGNNYIPIENLVDPTLVPLLKKYPACNDYDFYSDADND